MTFRRPGSFCPKRRRTMPADQTRMRRSGFDRQNSCTSLLVASPSTAAIRMQHVVALIRAGRLSSNNWQLFGS